MESGYPSLDQYLDDCYGGIREEDLRKVLEQEYTAQAFEEEYAAGFAPTEKEMRDYLNRIEKSSVIIHICMDI